MIISLTTIPSRINHIKPVIDSIKKQTKPVEKILLWIPQDQKYNIPTFLKRDKLVEIKRCEDIGPGTKFLHTIKLLSKDQEFIIIDDDTVYSEFLVENLTKFPDIDAPKAIKGTYFENNKRYTRRFIVKNDHPEFNTLSTASIICGCDGVLLKPKFFTDDIFKIKEKQYSHLRNTDDMWMSSHFYTQKIKKYVVPATPISYADKLDVIWSKPPRPHIRFLDHIDAVQGGSYEKEEIYKELCNILTK